MDLSILIDRLPGSVYCKDLHGVYLGCNQYMAQMAGLASTDHIIGKTDDDLPWREQADALYIIDQTVIASGASKTLEETAKLANGTSATYLTTKAPLYDPHGNIIGIYGLSVDITKYKQFEHKLLQDSKTSRQTDIFSNLDQIIACLPSNIYWKDKDGIYRGCNNGMLEAIGASSKEEVIGKTDYDFAKRMGWNASVVEAFRKIDNEVICSGKAVFNVEEEPFHFANGQLINQLTNKVPLRDEQGNVVGVLGISIDMTERKNQETNFLEQVFSCMPGSVYWKDNKGLYRGYNEELAKLAGVSISELIGKTDYDLGKKLNWSTDIARWIAQVDQEIMTSGIPRLNYEELPFHFADGKTINQLSNKVPLRDKKGQVIGIVGVSIDITERKQMEEQLRVSKEQAEAASKAKTEFLENMRHDIRTPLTGIVGFSEIIKHEVTDPKVKEYANNLTASSYALLNLLNAVLEAIDVSSGEIPLLKKKFDLKEKLNTVIQLNQAKAYEKNLQLLFDYDPAIQTYLIGDATRLHRVALELVTNALNYTNNGHVRLSVRLAKETEKEVVIKLIVEDTGIGIEPERQQDIYIQFKRLIPSYEGIYKGFGLGLTIAKQFIEDLEGELYVESQVGVGSTFIAVVKLRKPLLDEALGSGDLLPLGYKQKSAVTAESELAQQSVTSITEASQQSRILVVEDNALAAQVVVNMLSSMDCQVEVADHGKLAVQMAETNQYDLIFMDIGLPDIDGYEVTKRIRLSELHKSHVPIIALTAHRDENNKQHCISIGMNAILTKPLGRQIAEDILTSFILYRKDKRNSVIETTQEDTAAVELPVFDFDHLKQQFGNDVVARQMIAMFLESLPRESEELQAAYEKRDWTAVKDLTHRLKGGVVYAGAMRLDRACLMLESAIKAGQNELWEGFYQQLLHEIALVEQANPLA